MQRKDVLTEVGLCAFLATLILVAYWGVWFFDYVYFDDPGYISENLWVQRGLSRENVRWAFTAMEQSNWHPLTWISHMADVQFHGRQVPVYHAGGHHMTNITFHVLNSSLIFLLLHWMTGRRWAALAIAALFAVHPMHVESVIWIAERKDMLSTFLGLLTMAAYIFYARRTDRRADVPIIGAVLAVLVGILFDLGRTSGITESWFHQLLGVTLAATVAVAVYVISRRRYIVAIYCLIFGLYAFGLLAKPMLVTLPCLFLLLDYWPLERLRSLTAAPEDELPEPLRAPRRRVKRTTRPSNVTRRTSPALPKPALVLAFERLMYLVLEKVPLFALAAVSAYITPIAQVHGGSMASEADLPLPFRIANALQSYLTYIGRMFYPGKMTVLYLLDTKQDLKYGVYAGMILAAITIVILVGTFLLGRRYLAVGWFWYVGVLVPVIGLVQVGEQTMADRYTYFSYVGLFIIGAFGITDLIDQMRSYRLAAGLAALCWLSVVLAVCCRATHAQAQFWRDPESLLTHALEITPDNWSMNNNMGVLHWEMSQADLKEAAMALSEAAHWEREGKSQLAAELRAKAEELKKEAERLKKDAIAHWKHGVSVRETAADIHNNLGYALAEANDIDGAEYHLKRSIELKPILPGPHNNLGRIYLRRNNPDGAIAEFREAIRLDPSLLEARSNLAEVFGQQKRWAESEQQYREIAALQSPDPRNIPPEKIQPFTTCHVRLAEACERNGRMKEAVEECERAIQLMPQDWHLHSRLAICLWQLGDFPRAQPIVSALLHQLPQRVSVAEEFVKTLDDNKKPREALLARAFCASIFASSPNPAVRDGALAVRLAEAAATAAGGKDPDVLVILSMAYAEAGRFGDALGTAQQAKTLAHSQGKADLEKDIDSKLQLYQNRTPFHLQQPQN